MQTMKINVFTITFLFFSYNQKLKELYLKIVVCNLKKKQILD